MNDAEDICGCLACAALCGVCCVAAAEEDKRERERAAAEATGRLKNPMIQVNPVAVLSPRSQKAVGAAVATAGDQRQYQDHYFCPPRSPPPRQTARKSASYRSNAYLPASR